MPTRKTRPTDDKNASKHNLVFHRTFETSVEPLWKAFTDSDYVMQWWGPDHFSCPSAQMDFQVGGTSLVCMRAPKEFGGLDMYSTWHYVAIKPLKRIEYLHNLTDKKGKKIDPTTLGMPADFPQDQRHVASFKSLRKNTTELTFTEYGWKPGKMREMSKMGMEQCLNKMAAIFA